MKNIIILRKLTVSITFSGIIIYFMMKVEPFYILIPFLICGLSQIGVCIGALTNVKGAVQLMNKIYALSVGVYYFGFLLFALYLCVRDQNWGMLLYSVPFWIVGFYMIKGRVKKNS